LRYRSSTEVNDRSAGPPRRRRHLKWQSCGR
jgi:hypothetical protein